MKLDYINFIFQNILIGSYLINNHYLHYYPKLYIIIICIRIYLLRYEILLTLIVKKEFKN
jgi:hypothetical protein